MKNTIVNKQVCCLRKKEKTGEIFMNKGKLIIFPALLMSCFLSISAGAKSIGNDTYRICKNDMLIDYDQLNCKKIVTEIKDDGSFLAVDLGEWLEEQDIYDISVIEDEESAGYKKVYYERKPEKEEADEFYDSEDTSYINFQGLVYAGDVIRSTDSFMEMVTEVEFDGSFYTETEPKPDDLVYEAEELYMDEVTDLYSSDEGAMCDDDSATAYRAEVSEEKLQQDFETAMKDEIGLGTDDLLS